MKIPCQIRAGISVLAQLSAKWFHSVTDALNNMSGRGGVRIEDKEDGGKEVVLDPVAAGIPDNMPGKPADAATVSVLPAAATGTLPTPLTLDWKLGDKNGFKIAVPFGLQRVASNYSQTYCQIAEFTVSRGGLIIVAKAKTDGSGNPQLYRIY